MTLVGKKGERMWIDAWTRHTPTETHTHMQTLTQTYTQTLTHRPSQTLIVFYFFFLGG